MYSFADTDPSAAVAEKLKYMYMLWYNNKILTPVLFVYTCNSMELLFSIHALISLECLYPRSEGEEEYYSLVCQIVCLS